MKDPKQPVFMIGVAAELCGVHPQTLRQYEKLGLVVPARVGAKNRLYSEEDIERVRQIQRLTQDMGVNLAGVEIVFRLLDDMDEMRRDYEEQFLKYMSEIEARLQTIFQNSNAPVRLDGSILPAPQFDFKKRPPKL